MNFLAHLHIAHTCQSNLLGNLLGDFVKGDPSLQYDADITNGIRLHRFVDSYTDAHASMALIKPLFLNKTRRFSPIALDVFWDHCLAKHWHDYHSTSLRVFCDQAESELTLQRHVNLPARYLHVSQAMWSGRWLESYQDLENVEYALARMSQRSARMSELRHCFQYLERNYNELTDVFEILYPDVLNAAKSVSF